jgi:site-specific DNA-methyltransferase (adenine-specific)
VSVFDIKTDRAHLMLGDCLERMAEIPDGSVGMILTDPPYGTTACKWDSVIDLPQMWAHLKRVIKPNGAIVMTAAQPFTTTLIASNIRGFKYEWIYEKTVATNFLNAKKQPLRAHENVLVFYGKQPTYNPEMIERAERKTSRRVGTKTDCYGKADKETVYDSTSRYPRSVQLIKSRAEGSHHPTQKPVALMEYLIKTYTNESETVLDFTMGSGTTGVACARTGRKFIGIERDANYYGIAAGRVLAEVGDL